jgi:hypothetical protein
MCWEEQTWWQIGSAKTQLTGVKHREKLTDEPSLVVRKVGAWWELTDSVQTFSSMYMIRPSGIITTWEPPGWIEFSQMCLSIPLTIYHILAWFFIMIMRFMGPREVLEDDVLASKININLLMIPTM